MNKIYDEYCKDIEKEISDGYDISYPMFCIPKNIGEYAYVYIPFVDENFDTDDWYLSLIKVVSGKEILERYADDDDVIEKIKLMLKEYTIYRCKEGTTKEQFEKVYTQFVKEAFANHKI